MKNTIPIEYHAVIGGLFPEDCAGAKHFTPKVEAFLAFAQALGVGQNYSRLRPFMVKQKLGGKAKGGAARSGGGAAPQDDFHAFLVQFQENVDLLAAKTWVEKDDEERKEHLKWRIPGFVEQVEKGDYAAALIDFADIIGELAHLLFGSQSQKSDFPEYTFRIEPQMGLFFWYGFHLSVFFEQKPEIARDALLLGMCYLTYF